MCLIHNIIPKENDRMTDFFSKKIFSTVSKFIVQICVYAR